MSDSMKNCQRQGGENEALRCIKIRQKQWWVFLFCLFFVFFSSFYQATVASFTQGKLSQQAYNAFNDVVANKKVYDL